MANRNYNRAQNLEKEVKSLFLDVAIGATGAPTLTKAMGTASIARNSAGNYTITLQDAYVRLMSFECMNLASSAQGLNFELVAESVASAKTIQFRCLDLDGTPSPTDPANPSRLLIRIDLKNSTADRS